MTVRGPYVWKSPSGRVVMSDVTKICQCASCLRVDYLHSQESEYGRRERMAAGAGDLRNAEHYGSLRTNALNAAERRLRQCKGEGPWKEYLTLPADEVLGCKKQRAELLERHPDKGMITVCIEEADREAGDADGLTEVPFCCRCDRLVSGDPTAAYHCPACQDKEKS